MSTAVDYTSNFQAPAAQGAASVEIASARTAQEVQAMVVMAKRFPRDPMVAFQAILRHCERYKLAESSQYAYPRGDKLVTGPSIRLAEVLAQSWGNIDFGIVELEQRDGESQVLAYCWDLETNCRQAKVFTVPHFRQTKRGKQRLTDPRDIYEMVANQGARRLRACILGVIPGDVIEAAIDRCNATLAKGEPGEDGKGKKRLIDRVRSMVEAFREFGVTSEQIERRLNHKLDAVTEAELVQLRRIYTSLRDGMASASSYFEFEAPKPQTNTADDIAGDFEDDDLPADRRRLTPEEKEPEESQPETTTETEAADDGDRADGFLVDAIVAEFDRLGYGVARRMSICRTFGAAHPERLDPESAAKLLDHLEGQSPE